MERKTAVIQFDCACGTRFQLQDERLLRHAVCPNCRARAENLAPVTVTEDKPAELPPAPSLVIQSDSTCVNHPGTHATIQCLKCGKPICSACVRTNGYFCSASCKATLKAAVPNVQSGEDVEAIDEKVGLQMDKIMGVVRVLKWPALLLVLAGVGYGAYALFWAGRGKVAASMGVASDLRMFRAAAVEPFRIVGQSDDELFCALPFKQAKTWSVKLQTWESGAPAGGSGQAPPSQISVDEDDEDSPGRTSSPKREGLGLAVANVEHVIVHSKRQLLEVDSKDGKLRWRISKPGGAITRVIWHKQGVLCIEEPDESGAGKQARLANYSHADGSLQWAVTNRAGLYSEPIVLGGEFAMLVQKDSVEAARLLSKGIRPKRIGGAEDRPTGTSYGLETWDDIAVPVGQYELQFRALTDGRVVHTQPFSFAEAARIQRLGSYLCVVSANELLVFGSGKEPIWKKPLKGSAQIAAGGDIIALAANGEAEALDAQNGQVRWTYRGFPVNGVEVGPDGFVYVTVGIPREDAMKGEAAKYPRMIISELAFDVSNKSLLTLLQLDRQTGKVRWGVKNAGRNIRFAEGRVICFDQVARLQALDMGGRGGGGTDFRVTCLSTRDGKQLWYYAPGRELELRFIELLHFEAVGSSAFIVVSEIGLRESRKDQLGLQLQIVHRK